MIHIFKLLTYTVLFKHVLQSSVSELKDIFKVTIPQAKPLSPGEILGCTSPKLDPDINALMWVPVYKLRNNYFATSNYDTISMTTAVDTIYDTKSGIVHVGQQVEALMMSFLKSYEKQCCILIGIIKHPCFVRGSKYWPTCIMLKLVSLKGAIFTVNYIIKLNSLNESVGVAT